MLDLLTSKYPNTNYSGVMLDYYIKKLNEVIAEVNKLTDEVDKLPGYVKNAEIISNSYLKVTFGNDIVKTYALPTGTNFTFTVQEHEGETTLLSLDVDEEETYTVDCTRAQFNEALNAGLPVEMRYFVYNILNFPLTTITLEKIGGYVGFSLYDHTDIVDHSNWRWKYFQVGYNNIDDQDYFYIRRIY